MKTTTTVLNFKNRQALKWLCPLFKVTRPKKYSNSNYQYLSIRHSEEDTSTLIENILLYSKTHKNHSFELIQIFESENNEVNHVYEVQNGRMTFKYLEARTVIDMPESVISNIDLYDMAVGAVHSLSRLDLTSRIGIIFYPWEASTTIEEDGLKVTVIKNRNIFKVVEVQP